MLYFKFTQSGLAKSRSAICIFISAIFFITLNAHSANTEDSLRKILNQSNNIQVKLETLKQLGNLSFKENPNASLAYWKQLRMLAKKENKLDYLAESMGWLAYLYEQQGSIDSALSLNFKSFELAEKMNEKASMGTLLNNIAAIYKDKGKIDSALYFHERSLKIKREIDDQAGIAVSYSNIGLIYQNQGQFNKALNNYFQALSIQEKLNDKSETCSTLHNISTLYKEQKEYDKAIAYSLRVLSILNNQQNSYDKAYTLVNLGDLMQLKGDYKQALSYLEKSIQIRLKIDDKQGLANSYLKTGLVYLHMDNIEKAINYTKNALELHQSIKDKWGISRSQNLLSEIYFKTGQFKKSEVLAKDALKVAQEIGFPITIKQAAELLYKIYYKQGNWQQAFKMQSLYYSMKDSLQNIEISKKAIESNYQYEYKQKVFADSVSFSQKEAVKDLQLNNSKIKLRQQNSIIIFIVLVLFLIILLAYFINLGKKKSDALLLNILPKEVANELKQKGFAEAKQIENVTVIFTDFKGFTQLSEKMSAKELVKEINACFSAFDGIMDKYNIEKIKTIGDSYMAAGGIPTANNTHAKDVIEAALEIQKFMQNHKKDKILKNELFFEIRIGVHTGPVVAGIVGVKKFAYDIWGDTVNTASRMESSGEVGKINISGTTYDLIKDEFNCIYRGKLEAKGKGEIDMYFVSNIYN